MDMKTSIEKMPQDSLYKLDDIFRKCAVEVFTILMGRTPNGKSDSMDWVTMKNYRHKCRERIVHLEHQLQTMVAEERSKFFEMQKKLGTHFKEVIGSQFSLDHITLGSNTAQTTLASEKDLMSGPPSTINVNHINTPQKDREKPSYSKSTQKISVKKVFDQL